MVKIDANITKEIEVDIAKSDSWLDKAARWEKDSALATRASLAFKQAMKYAGTPMASGTSIYD